MIRFKNFSLSERWQYRTPFKYVHMFAYLASIRRKFLLEVILHCYICTYISFIAASKRQVLRNLQKSFTKNVAIDDF